MRLKNELKLKFNKRPFVEKNKTSTTPIRAVVFVRTKAAAVCYYRGYCTDYFVALTGTRDGGLCFGIFM